MISLQTNVTSLLAQQNLNADNAFQSKTIEQLTSGYRINSSGDDAAGLAIANTYRSNITELTQGVSNAHDGTSQLQIIDGGLSNISTILDRLKTLATQSASDTFTGSRATLNQEYSGLLSEINRQASNVNLNAGGSFNTNLNVYIGGAGTSNNASVHVDLSGASSAVDAASLGLGTSNVLGGGVGITTGSANTLRIDAPGASFVVGTAGTDDQTFSFNLYSGGSAQTVTATVAASAGGTSLSNVLSSLNGQLNKYGISAGTDSNGLLQFSGATAFSLKDNGTIGSGTSLLTNDTNGTAENTSNFVVDGGTYAAPTAPETVKFQTANGAATVTIGTGSSLATAISAINAQTSSLGVYAVLNAAGTGVSLQGSNSFSVQDTAQATKGIFAAASTYATSTAPATGTTNNASAAISAINNAIQSLGLVQGRIGAGENKLQYASSLAQSQISSFSAAQSQIRDADVASQAANLTKAQVLTQTSVAALAQANSAPQSILKLLQ